MLSIHLSRSRSVDSASTGSASMSLIACFNMARARAFYERQGFTVAGARQFLVGETLHDDAIYARAI